MKHVPTIAGALLGLVFAGLGAAFLAGALPEPPPPPEGSPVALFMGAMAPTGYLAFVKVLELLGGVFVAIPKTRRVGLVILWPILVNIVAFHVFLSDPSGLLEPMLLVILALAAYLSWCERGLLRALVAS